MRNSVWNRNMIFYPKKLRRASPSKLYKSCSLVSGGGVHTKICKKYGNWLEYYWEVIKPIVADPLTGESRWELTGENLWCKKRRNVP